MDGLLIIQVEVIPEAVAVASRKIGVEDRLSALKALDAAVSFKPMLRRNPPKRTSPKRR